MSPKNKEPEPFHMNFRHQRRYPQTSPETSSGPTASSKPTRTPTSTKNAATGTPTTVSVTKTGRAAPSTPARSSTSTQKQSASTPAKSSVTQLGGAAPSTPTHGSTKTQNQSASAPAASSVTPTGGAAPSTPNRSSNSTQNQYASNPTTSSMTSLRGAAPSTPTLNNTLTQSQSATTPTTSTSKPGSLPTQSSPQTPSRVNGRRQFTKGSTSPPSPTTGLPRTSAPSARREMNTQRDKAVANSTQRAKEESSSTSQPADTALPYQSNNDLPTTPASKGEELASVAQDDSPHSPIVNTRSKTRSPPENEQLAGLTAKDMAIIAKHPALKVKFERMGFLKAKFAGVSKPLKSGLKELATRSEHTLLEDNADEPAVKEVMRQLEQNFEYKKNWLLLRHDLRKEQETRKYEQTTGEIENSYHRQVEDIQTEALAHAKLDYMTTIYNNEAPPEDVEAHGLNMGQGSNDRDARKPPADGRSTALYMETERRQNQEFYERTGQMWDSWIQRVKSLPSDVSAEEMRAVLPEPWKQVQANKEEALQIKSILKKQQQSDEQRTRKVIGQEQGPKPVVNEPKKVAFDLHGHYAKGIQQTKQSKQGPGFVAHGAAEMRYRDARLKRIREEKAKKTERDAGAGKGRGGKRGRGKR